MIHDCLLNFHLFNFGHLHVVREKLYTLIFLITKTCRFAVQKENYISMTQSVEALIFLLVCNFNAREFSGVESISLC